MMVGATLAESLSFHGVNRRGNALVCVRGEQSSGF